MWIIPEMLACGGRCIPIMLAFVCTQRNRKQSMLIRISDSNYTFWLNM